MHLLHTKPIKGGRSHFFVTRALQLMLFIGLAAQWAMAQSTGSIQGKGDGRVWRTSTGRRDHGRSSRWDPACYGQRR
jgi:hypothetical protein